MSDRPSLALDIGTRKVVGLLTVPGPKGLKIIAAAFLEHSTRAMYDGQIHDVAAVAAVVDQIVRKLTAKAGTPLTEAAVAAAGRSLRTFRGTASRELSGLTEMTPDDVFALELEAVQAAQEAMAGALADRESARDYHYVGHSSMGARLDGLSIANLAGQRGTHAELDVIATFLPRGVVDSLQAVLQRTGLEMTALTLEPIAALTVAVPQSMRHLNLVLVDIGAGTSDIAITSKGSVVAYDMVPIAGDEITEALSELYLLDFNAGEAVKRQLTVKEQVTFTDILGQKQTVDTAEVCRNLAPAVERLAGQIAERVLKLNGAPPQAIMLVGGGSLTPGLPGALAAAVGLTANRVAVRGRDAVSGVEGAKSLLSGPDCITPIGIAVAARDRSTLGFQLVYVNQQGVRLFHPSRLTVADALLAGGVAIRDLQGRVGKGLTVSVNGALQIIRGTFGRPARILVNEEPATLDTPISHRDQVTVIPGAPGESGRATVADVAPAAAERLVITVNRTDQAVLPVIIVNGEAAGPDRPLADNDTVTVRQVATIGDVMLRLGFEAPDQVDITRYVLDGVARVARRPRYQIRLNGAIAGADMPARDGDFLEVQPTPSLLMAEATDGVIAGGGMLRIRVNGQILELPGGAPAISRNGRPASPEEPIHENDVITVTPGQESPIFAQLLAHVGIALSPPPGKSRLAMVLNGGAAEFTTPIKDGDIVELSWE